MTECEEDLGDVTTVDPLGQGHDENEKDKKDVMIRNVDPNLLRVGFKILVFVIGKHVHIRNIFMNFLGHHPC